MNIDLEIAKLTKESIDRLMGCKNKEEFATVVEEFDELKTHLYDTDNPTDTRKKSKTFFYWYGRLEESYAWLIKHYLYIKPDLDLEILPDICKGNSINIVFPLAYTHLDRLDWFSAKSTNGTKLTHTPYVRNAVKKIDPNVNIIKKMYLGDNLFFITKCIKVVDEHFIREIFCKFCFSFEEFVSELDGNLSDAELGDYTISEADIEKYNIILSSEKTTDDKEEDISANISVKKISDNSFSVIDNKNEIVTAKSTGIAPSDKSEVCEFRSFNIPFYYISDIHLCHYLQRKNISTPSDIEKEIRNIVKKIKASFMKYENETSGYRFSHKIVFNGDISSDKNVFHLFVKELHRQGIENALFILGNHEYWDFGSITEAVSWYKKTVAIYGYCCLHNEVLLMNDDKWKLSEKIVAGSEIVTKSTEEIIDLTKNARYVVIGGTGFAGCNNQYNALKGLYRASLGAELDKARELEIEESNKFEEIYMKLLSVLNDRQVIVCTHNPIEDWTVGEYWHNWIYVSGHTHINNRVVSDSKRIYADNQVGYNRAATSLKYFSVDTRNNVYASYKDGIYEIESIDYEIFMAGRNIKLTMDNRIDKLWMLKKNGYYAFMTRTQTQKRGLSICILNGSQKKRIGANELPYYYDRMMTVIERLEGVTIKYAEVVSKVADFVKSFGGSGYRHGCIVDIDYFSHLYVNPYDLKVTPYVAARAKDRVVYASLGRLLEDCNADMYNKYTKLISSRTKNELSINDNNSIELAYDEGYYLYKESNAIKRMDLLRTDKILTTWIDVEEDKLINMI